MVCPLFPSVQMDVLEMLPDVDADISTYPVGDGLVIEVAERPASPASRMLDQVSAGAGLCGAGAGRQECIQQPGRDLKRWTWR